MGSTLPWNKVFKDRPKSSGKRAREDSEKKQAALRAELEAQFEKKLEAELEKKLEEKIATMREDLIAQVRASMNLQPCLPSPGRRHSSCQSETAPSISPRINPLDTLEVRILYLSILDYNFEL